MTGKTLKEWLGGEPVQFGGMTFENVSLAGLYFEWMKRHWLELSDEARLEFLEAFPCCRHCGNLNEGCQCWNDE